MNMATRYSFANSVSAVSEGSRRSEMALSSLKTLLQLERSRDVSTNGESGKVDGRKRKLDAISVDGDVFREMVTIEIFFTLDIFSYIWFSSTCFGNYLLRPENPAKDKFDY